MCDHDRRIALGRGNHAARHCLCRSPGHLLFGDLARQRRQCSLGPHRSLFPARASAQRKSGWTCRLNLRAVVAAAARALPPDWARAVSSDGGGVEYALGGGFDSRKGDDIA